MRTWHKTRPIFAERLIRRRTHNAAGHRQSSRAAYYEIVTRTHIFPAFVDVLTGSVTARPGQAHPRFLQYAGKGGSGVNGQSAHVVREVEGTVVHDEPRTVKGAGADSLMDFQGAGGIRRKQKTREDVWGKRGIITVHIAAIRFGSQLQRHADLVALATRDRGIPVGALAFWIRVERAPVAGIYGIGPSLVERQEPAVRDGERRRWHGEGTRFLGNPAETHLHFRHVGFSDRIPGVARHIGIRQEGNGRKYGENRHHDDKFDQGIAVFRPDVR